MIGSWARPSLHILLATGFIIVLNSFLTCQKLPTLSTFFVDGFSVERFVRKEEENNSDCLTLKITMLYYIQQ